MRSWVCVCEGRGGSGSVDVLFCWCCKDVLIEVCWCQLPVDHSNVIRKDTEDRGTQRAKRRSKGRESVGNGGDRCWSVASFAVIGKIIFDVNVFEIQLLLLSFLHHFIFKK